VQTESGTLTGCGCQRYGAAHAFDAFFDDGQAEAGAFVFAIVALEKLKDPLLGVGVDANAIVLKGEVDVRVVLAKENAHPGLRAGRDEFDGVAEEVGNALSQGGFIAEDRRKLFL
jgi:hypothetical protein